MMGAKKGEVSNYLKILKLMDEYLESIDEDYSEMYRLLDEAKVEGPFNDLVNYLKAHRGQDARSTKGRDWEPGAEDIESLKYAYFYAVRAGLGTHELRVIGNPSKNQGLFNYGDLWKKNSSSYIDHIETITHEEPCLDELRKKRQDESPEKIIEGKELDYRTKAKPLTKKFIGIAEELVKNQSEKDKPIELIERALRTLEQVDTTIDSFVGDELYEMCHDIRKLAEMFIKELKD